MATITASLVVDFKNSAAASVNSILRAEIDTRDNGMNGGKTSFVAGDRVGYLIYKTADVTLKTQVTSAGNLAGKGTELIDIDEYIAFAGEQEKDLAYPVYSGWSATWYGKSLGNVSVLNGSRIRSGLEGTGILRVQYKALATKYELQSPSSINGQTEFPIVIYIPGEVA